MLNIEQVCEDIFLFRGKSYQSISTAILDGNKVLLVDALAEPADAARLECFLTHEKRCTVSRIVVTHYMSDHIAGLPNFPNAEIVAHDLFSHTYFGQRDRTSAEDKLFVEPTMTFNRGISFRWGRHSVSVRHNPGKTACAVFVDIPTADLVICGDAIVGNIVYLSSGAPQLLAQSLQNLQSLGRSRVIGGHIGVFEKETLDNAFYYLRRLGKLSSDAWAGKSLEEAEQLIKGIQIEHCLRAQVVASAFEQEWHEKNLLRIVERRLFNHFSFA